MIDVDITKRYWLFACEDYYPRGGLNDARGSFDTIEEADAVDLKALVDDISGMSGSLFDSVTRTEVRVVHCSKLEDPELIRWQWRPEHFTAGKKQARDKYGE